MLFLDYIPQKLQQNDKYQFLIFLETNISHQLHIHLLLYVFTFLLDIIVQISQFIHLLSNQTFKNRTENFL